MREREKKDSGQNEFEKTREGFKRLNEITIETNLVPRLHELFTKRDLEEGYIVLDGIETTYGFPIPVRTRYISALPTLLEEADLEKLDLEHTTYPGFVYSELINPFGLRAVEIQIGLDFDDVKKMAERSQDKEAQDILSSVKDGDTKPPKWWPYPYLAIDLSTSGNYSADERLFQEKSVEGLIPFEAFVCRWGRTNKGIVTAGFELEKYHKEQNSSLTRSWEQEQEKVEKGFKNMKKAINKLLKPGS